MKLPCLLNNIRRGPFLTVTSSIHFRRPKDTAIYLIMADAPNDEGVQHARYGTFTGTVSLIHNLLSLTELCDKKIGEFRSFDQTTTRLLIKFAQELARLEVWCQCMGYKRNANGTFGRPAALPLELTARPNNIVVIRLSLAEASRLIKEIVQGFEAMADASLGSMDNYLTYLQQTAPQSARNTSTSQDPESATSLDSSIEQAYSQLRTCGIVTQNPNSIGKVTEIVKKKQESLQLWLTGLSDQNGILEGFVMAQQIEIFARLVPNSLLDVRGDIQAVQGAVDTMQTHINGIQVGIVGVQQQLTADRLSTLFEASRGLDYPTQAASFHSLLELKNVNLVDLEGVVLRITINGHEIHDVRQYASEQNRRIASCRGSLRLVEWNKNIKVTGDEELKQVRRRLGNLVAGLGFDEPDELRLLSTLGYAEHLNHGKYHFGIIYNVPRSFGHEPPEVLSLKDLFPSTETQDAPKPSLGERFQLAATLARAFRNFQTSQWLHQSISSSNIIFFHAKGSSTSLNQPYIVGFDFARHVNSDSDRREDHVLEEDSYQHPSRRERGHDDKASYRYRGEFDIYSIGRLLVNIAEWEEVSNDELDVVVENLPYQMGTLYTHAVKWCLGLSEYSPVHENRIQAEAPPPEGTAAWSTQLIRAFEANVLIRIGGCRA